MAGKRTYSLDERFFSTIDTEPKAYFLGLLATDGWIQKRAVALALSETDGHIVDAFAEAIGFSGPVTTRRCVSRLASSGYCTMRTIMVSSKAMVADLATYGIVACKSLTVAPWSGPSHLQHHYWRGVVDGDGSVGVIRGHKTYCHVSLCGNLQMVSGFASFITSITGSSSRPRRDGRRCWKVTYNGNQLVKKIVSTLWSDATVSIHRKKACADAVLSIPSDQRPGSRLTLSDIDAEVERAGSVAAAAASLNMNPRTLIQLRYKRRHGRSNPNAMFGNTALRCVT